MGTVIIVLAALWGIYGCIALAEKYSRQEYTPEQHEILARAISPESYE
jgi:hypothetical protein